MYKDATETKDLGGVMTRFAEVTLRYNGEREVAVIVVDESGTWNELEVILPHDVDVRDELPGMGYRQAGLFTYTKYGYGYLVEKIEN